MSPGLFYKHICHSSSKHLFRLFIHCENIYITATIISLSSSAVQCLLAEPQRPDQTCPKPQKEFTQPVKCMALKKGSLNTLHGTALNCTAFNCFTQYSTEMFGVTLHFTVLHCTSLKIAAQYNVTLRRSAHYYAALHFTVRYYTSLYGSTLHCSSLNCTVRYETHVQSTVQYSELNLILH